MARSVICVSHADGARGQEIGRLLAERAGLRYVDEGIIGAAARAKGLYPEAVSLAESRGVKRRLEVDFGRSEQTETLRGLIRDAVAATADEGNVVIVAHAASYALADRDDVLRVLITASPETRLSRLAETGNLGRKGAAKSLKESDKGRAAYLKSFYDIETELPTHYDLVISTDSLSVDEAIGTIVRAAGLGA